MDYSDDMTVPLLEGQSVEEITNSVIQQALNGFSDGEIENNLVVTFNFSAENANLIRDRVFGGVFRAATNNSNRPNSQKDPFAYAGFKQALKNPSIFTFIYPESGQKSKNTWWKFW